MEHPGRAADNPTALTGDALQAGVDAAAIRTFVTAFYARVRLDPLIGPVFEEHVEDWDRYRDKAFAFWSALAARNNDRGDYPAELHLAHLSDRWHLDRWLELFETTAAETCRAETASYFVRHARRIADNLEDARRRVEQH